MDFAIAIIAFATLVVAFITLLNSIIQRTIPVEFGFLYNDAIVKSLVLSSGDEAKPIKLRFRNTSSTTLIGLVFNIEFLDPIRLSGTGSALTVIPGQTEHGRVEDQSYYLIRYRDILLPGKQEIDFRVEIDTRNQSPGNSIIVVTVYSTQADFKFKKTELTMRIS